MDTLIFEEETFFKTKYDGYYASKTGKILSVRKRNKRINDGPRILIGRIDKDGYVEYCMTIDGKQSYRRGHRIVAETFIPNPERRRTVNHKDGHKSNNDVSNLEWATFSENNLHRYKELGATAPNKQLVNLYKNGELIETGPKTMLLKYISYEYYQPVLNDEMIFRHMHLERKDGKIIAYWNGKILRKFEDRISEVAKFFGKKNNTISGRLHQKPTRVMLFAKEYTVEYVNV